MNLSSLHRYVQGLARLNTVPLHVTSFITARCPLRCKTCFYWRHLDKSQSELTFDEISRLAPTLRGVLWLAIGGGEPFVRSDLAEVMEVLAREANPPYLTLVTNGFYPDRIERVVKAIFKAKPGVLLRINVSVDGVGSLHDSIRGKPGSFEKACETITVLQELQSRHRNLHLLVGTCFNAFNQDAFEEIPAYLTGRFGAIPWDFVLVRGDPSDPASKEGADVDRYLQLKRRYGLSVERGSGAGLLDHIISVKDRGMLDAQEQILRTGQNPVKCRAGSISAVVQEQGEVVTCETLALPMGDLREHDMDMRRLWRSPRAAETREKLKLSHRPCSHECNLATNLFFSPAALAKAMWRASADYRS